MSRLNVRTKVKRFPAAPELYGLFFEDISHAGDGGLYPEMIRNRSFEDSLLPEGCTTKDGGKTFESPPDGLRNSTTVKAWPGGLKATMCRRPLFPRGMPTARKFPWTPGTC